MPRRRGGPRPNWPSGSRGMSRKPYGAAPWRARTSCSPRGTAPERLRARARASGVCDAAARARPGPRATRDARTRRRTRRARAESRAPAFDASSERRSSLQQFVARSLRNFFALSLRRGGRLRVGGAHLDRDRVEQARQLRGGVHGAVPEQAAPFRGQEVRDVVGARPHALDDADALLVRHHRADRARLERGLFEPGPLALVVPGARLLQWEVDRYPAEREALAAVLAHALVVSPLELGHGLDGRGVLGLVLGAVERVAVVSGEPLAQLRARALQVVFAARGGRGVGGESRGGASFEQEEALA